ncbi:unnamed protein product [Zymoseptoria tritici ST99CH_3D7]|uniref:G domain-containing protein n=1 Tax=Zymoseptoria tritici (strain ST99CH_3D7) TaxID=1276538 RepID=A0A1X7S6K3_ZYMT9|nr:unnamed protein product [Zymoseptoria tritici ST99CH_3D7]
MQTDNSSLQSIGSGHSRPPVRATIKPPIVIAVFGQTGTGKTSFIKAVTGKNLEIGHSLTSCTDAVREVPCTIDGENVVLIDTPGFSDTHLSDTEILRRIAEWMQDAYDEGSLLSGIIYLHRITDVRMDGPSLKNLRMMKKLCGTETLRNVVLTTTMWENVTPDDGRRREKELAQKFWKNLLNEGAKIARVTNRSPEVARSLVRTTLKNRPTSTALQEELFNGISLAKTEAGIEIREEMAKLELKLKAEHKAELDGLKAAQRDRNTQLERQLRNENAETRRRLERLEAEKRDLEQLTPKVLYRVERSGLFGWGSYRCRSCGIKTKRMGRWTCTSCGRQQRNAW